MAARLSVWITFVIMNVQWSVSHRVKPNILATSLFEADERVSSGSGSARRTEEEYEYFQPAPPSPSLPSIPPLPPLPPREIRLEGKAGGAHGQMLVSDDKSRILKPMDQGEESSAELKAYEILKRSPLGPFLCTFFGTRTVADVEYMELESAYLGMKGPTATLDIKMGKITWDDHAPREKIERHKKKLKEIYADSTAMLGYRVAGMKAGALKLSAENLKARRSLLKEEFGEWLFPAFFASDPGYGSLPSGRAGEVQPEALTDEIDKQAAREMLGHLKVLSFAAESGFGGVIRSSSILLTREMRLGGVWSLRLIDLAHYTPDGRYDTNFCDGLRNLIEVWEAWLE